MRKHLVIAALGFAFGLAGFAPLAAAQTANKKPAQTARAQAGAPLACPPGVGKNGDGSCMSAVQVAAANSARLRADCMVQARMNYNWCPSVLPGADTLYPKEKDWDVFGFSPAGVMSAPAGALPSDIRLKRDITQVAQLDNGINLYSFRYWWSDQAYVGVMAQQVAEIAPDAVVMAPNGYLAVYYDRIGLKMQRLEEWQAAH
jgi:hypothetical protein